ncbi:hypothetical protein PROAA_830021 [Candidatus Propionivibrio aalborgensis]|uniref:Uncharacterized protein n=1 Tax=Candidatus Propionivibrio aalborgensis TaxID=1860101 RepID=A0A1A8Y247_9RHOO|nr:hypothetical protein PROAA_830021 [Candidatus Propionivibrio aalborgensis]
MPAQAHPAASCHDTSRNPGGPDAPAHAGARVTANQSVIRHGRNRIAARGTGGTTQKKTLETGSSRGKKQRYDGSGIETQAPLIALDLDHLAMITHAMEKPRDARSFLIHIKQLRFSSVFAGYSRKNC